jgi:hypothetical protein
MTKYPSTPRKEADAIVAAYVLSPDDKESLRKLSDHIAQALAEAEGRGMKEALRLLDEQEGDIDFLKFEYRQRYPK